jgi:DNA repair protein RAD57
MSSEGGAGGGDDYDPDMAAPTLKSWRRWMKVVFAHHAKASGNGIDGAVEFEITLGGLKAVKRGDKKSKLETPL